MINVPTVPYVLNYTTNNPMGSRIPIPFLWKITGLMTVEAQRAAPPAGVIPDNCRKTF